jgi:Rrf2 family iron-sulfur cluster assembly transcriptional regulator
MRLSTKSRLAITALIDVVAYQEWGAVSLSSMSERTKISLSYLEGLFARFRKAGLVESARGPGGGYTMHKSPLHTTLLDILIAVEGDLWDQHDSAHALWMQAETWSKLHAVLIEQLRAITLNELVQEHQKTHTPTTRPLKALRSKNAPGIFKRPSVKLISPTTPNSVFSLGQWVASQN